MACKSIGNGNRGQTVAMVCLRFKQSPKKWGRSKGTPKDSRTISKTTPYATDVIFPLVAPYPPAEVYHPIAAAGEDTVQVALLPWRSKI